MSKYRIIHDLNKPSGYIIEKKGWFFWAYYLGWLETFEEAEELVLKLQTKDAAINARKHLPKVVKTYE